MKSKPRALGSFLLIFGLMLYQFGLLAALHQTALIDYVLNIFPDIQLLELIGILLQLLGGFLIVVGFTSLFSGIIAIQIENEMRNLGYEILSRVEERISNVMARQRLNMSPQNPPAARTCKFCATQLGDEDVFCPTCGKSQK
jgi:hypothetical protein